MSVKDFTDLYHATASERPFLAQFLVGHLAVEFLLRKLVGIYDPNLSSHADKLRHAELINLNHALGTISDEQREVLVSINKMRNKLAHEMTYTFSVDELYQLFKKAGRAFSDLTDGISQGLDELDNTKCIDSLEEWVIPEFFIQITYDLHGEYTDRGGDIEDF